MTTTGASTNGHFSAVYRGLVTNDMDPEGLLRIKATVPQIFGNNNTETDWAWPVFPYGTAVNIPPPGSTVWIQFVGGDLNYPTWNGTWQGVKSSAGVTFNVIGTLHDVANLPTTGNQEGDAYIVNGVLWVYLNGRWTDDYNTGNPGFNLMGSLTDVSQLPMTGNQNGDAYMVNGVLWVWEDGQWTDVYHQGTVYPSTLTGEIRLWSLTTPPNDQWLICDGTSYPRTNYARLFSVIGTTFGSVDSSSFNVPDLRGRFPLGAGLDSSMSVTRTPGTTGGANNHVLTIAEVPAHDHGTHQHGTHQHGSHDHGQHYHDKPQNTGASGPTANWLGIRDDGSTEGLVNFTVLASVLGTGVLGQRMTFYAGGVAYNTVPLGAVPLSAVPTSTVPMTGGGTAMSLMPPFMALSYIIAI